MVVTTAGMPVGIAEIARAMPGREDCGKRHALPKKQNEHQDEGEASQAGD